MSPAAASSCLRPSGSCLERWPAQPLCRLREYRPGLSLLCPRRTRLLFGDVRGWAFVRRRPDPTADGGPQLRPVAPCLRDAVCTAVPGKAATRADDEPACLGAVAWHRFALCPRRWRPSEITDDPRRPARGGSADLSAWPRHYRRISRTDAMIRSLLTGGQSEIM